MARGICGSPNHEATTVAGAPGKQLFHPLWSATRTTNSDQGKRVPSSGVFFGCSSLMGNQENTHHTITPQSDGMVERYNRTLLHKLAKFASDDRGIGQLQAYQACSWHIGQLSYESLQRTTPGEVDLVRPRATASADLATGRPRRMPRHPCYKLRPSLRREC
ncbi:hypothetical protein GWK47_039802 [Chionoecetes opilio]|uniref:Integrase catalytic domain-containing protein n=1 Tax=Chionoecetes opilio TaxID=41210 RepID=A0A8J4YCK0_CHIOP|nr:hypothetical protein GWK47_039802 [Chionoecetes opilio]